MELATLLAAAVAGEATTEQLQHLNDILVSDPRMVSLAVDLMAQENWLGWHSDSSRFGELRPEILELLSEVAEAASCDAKGSDLETALELPDIDASEVSLGCSLEGCSPEGTQADTRSSLFPASLAPLRGLAGPVLTAVGFLLGMVVSNYFFPEQQTTDQLANSGAPADPLEVYVGRLVNDTACLWNLDNRPSVETGNALRAGESLSLLEGLAELELDWDSGAAMLKIEGPAGLILTADHGASLSHGKVIADVRIAKLSSKKFTLNTPNGLIELSESASLGVVVAANSVEVHVFRGEAKVQNPWTREGQASQDVVVRQGESVSLVAEEFGTYRQQRGIASPATFAAKMSMGTDSLPITEHYVAAVLADNPLLYWRFEGLAGGKVPGSTRESFNGIVVGEANSTANRGNRSLQLGHRPSDKAFSSYLISDKPIEHDFETGYSLEVWIKPSHYHWGSIVAMITPPKNPGWRSNQGLLLEIGGPYANKPDIERPGRFRFLHRSPPSIRRELGTSIFSDAVYSLRKWQHVVAVKDADRLLLYVDGNLVSTGTDNTQLSSGMKLLVGQLDREQFYRGFIGQLDELAFYPHPLSEETVLKHYHLVRPKWNKPERHPQQESDDRVI